ncbi:MAG: glycosyltransferase family 2 protein [Oscillospiraceae bacterium]|nr:glycosyltransferase family 2 protein [Oscillospiraceae bacterium]
MKISFIIPVYNCKEYLPACVASIQTAVAEDYEILLIDDGSTDGSGAVCDELSAKFSEIQVVHQENAGASAARNQGILEASGELLLFIDADDSIDSAALGRVLADPHTVECDLTIFGLTFDYYHNGKCYRQDPLYHDYDGVMDRSCWSNNFVQLYRDNSLSPVWNKVFKRNMILAHNLELDTSMFLYEDFEFVLRYISHCDTIWNVPQAIYHYRQSEDEGNAGRRLKRIPSIPEFLKPIEAALQQLPQEVSTTSRAMVLQQLYLVLAREKIAASDIQTITRICTDYQKWSKKRLLPLEQDRFQKLLLEGRAMQLWLRNKKTLLRHWIAVRVKALRATRTPIVN